MSERLLPARESMIWIVCFLAMAALIVVTGFTSTDSDSALYAALADRLTQEPIERWLAPEWWGFWAHVNMSGLFREHPAGVLLLPAGLARVGIPAMQGAYIVGVAAGLASLLLMAGLIRRFTVRDDARVALVLLQLMPVAFVFRIRANHEYPMLVCLLVALHGLVAASSRSLLVAIPLVSLGLAGGLIIKGVFVAKILLAIALWIAINPTGEAGARGRSAIAAVIGTAVMIAVAIGYDAIHYAATLEPFWSLYWQRQLGPLTDVGALDVVVDLGKKPALLSEPAGVASRPVESGARVCRHGGCAASSAIDGKRSQRPAGRDCCLHSRSQCWRSCSCRRPAGTPSAMPFRPLTQSRARELSPHGVSGRPWLRL